MSTEETVSHIAKALGEVEETPLTQIEGVLRVLGEDVTLSLLKETLEIESKGGQLLADGTRRRSPGGVFFQLARKKLPVEERKEIFRERKPAGGDDPPASARTETAASPTADASRLTRRRVVEVIPARAGAVKGKASGFTPPELPSALTRARIRQQVNQAVAPLPIEEQYHLLLDLLADIHDRVTGGANPPAGEAASPARTSRGGARRR